MMQAKTCLLLVFSLCLLVAASISAGEDAAALDPQVDKFYGDVAEYFEVTRELVDSVAATGVPAPELPVIFVVAKDVNASPIQLAKARKSGHTWTSIMDVRGGTSRALYFMLSGNIDSRTYAPIFAKFNAVPEDSLHAVKLSDEEIIDLANLRFIYRHNDYSVFEVMAFRDKGKEFVSINSAVSEIKKEMIKQEKIKAREKRRQEAEKNAESSEG